MYNNRAKISVANNMNAYILNNGLINDECIDQTTNEFVFYAFYSNIQCFIYSTLCHKTCKLQSTKLYLLISKY